MKATNRRQFAALGKLDHPSGPAHQGKGFFTVGVVVDKIGVLTSKSGKNYTVLKLSDLVKHDVAKMKAMLGMTFGKDLEGYKTALRAFNSDGYKAVTLMAFGESALAAKKIPSGTVVAVLTPRLLQSNPNPGEQRKNEGGLTFCVDSPDALISIGFSSDFNICTEVSVNSSSGKQTKCTRFVNTSIQRICDEHKARLQANRLTKF